MAYLKCAIMTPQATVLECEAQFVSLTLIDGEIGIGPHHAPLAARLGYGEMRVRDSKRILRYYLDGGFVQVTGQTVCVLTNRAIAAESLSEFGARQQLREAQRQPTFTPELRAIRDRLVAQARARLLVNRHAKEEK
jgi:F-type H+-transporting ATPase subunit epsilon